MLTSIRGTSGDGLLQFIGSPVTDQRTPFRIPANRRSHYTDARQEPGFVEELIADLFGLRTEHHKWLDRYFSGDSSEWRLRAMIADTQDGPYLLLDPYTREPKTTLASAAPVFSPELATKWFYGDYLPPTAEELSGASEDQSGMAARLRPLGAHVQVRYPSGEMFSARHRETGAYLSAGGSAPVVLTAAQAERLGLTDWMPYTFGDLIPGPQVPGIAPYPPRSSKRRDWRRWIGEQLIELIPGAVPERYDEVLALYDTPNMNGANLDPQSRWRQW